MNGDPAIDAKRQRCCAILALVMGLCLANALWAESGISVVNVQDVHKHPVGGVQIGVEGDGGSAVTDDHGKARIRLAAQNKQKDWVSLQILKSPPGKDLVMVSPWDSRTPIPSFENESENFVIDEKALGPDHPDVAIDLNNLASLLQAKGDYAGAETLYRRALAIDEKALGADHPDTMTVRANLQIVIDKQSARQKEK